MSTGIVICSICKRELHQSGDRAIENGWMHCEDRTPRCSDGSAVFPESTAEIVGKWCGMDDPDRPQKRKPPTPPTSEMDRIAMIQRIARR